ncbi:MAG: aldehyde dehydrogenase family protein, partial [Halieaceae bacterium]|nr:aldehyde dehydrogenase family protein [Halieaceae bacterium]
MSAYHLIIDGKAVDTVETFPVVNPATEQIIAQCPRAGTEELDRAVAAARRAFPAWSQSSDSERCRLMHAIGDALGEATEELAGLLTLEQ